MNRIQGFIAPLRKTPADAKIIPPQLLLRASFSWLLPAMLLLALPAAVQAQFLFTTNNGTITITGYTGSGGVVAIPSVTNGLPVTGIGNSAFYSKTSLTSVTIPNSVTRIGTNSFYQCSGLTNITIGASVTNMGDYAFYSCSKLSSIEIPNGVTSIAGHSFQGCTKLTNVMFGTSIAGIGEYAFGGCGLTNVTIPNSVTRIGNGAFTHCVNLASVTIPDSVTNIGTEAFLSCDSLRAIKVDALNSYYCDVAGIFFNKNQTTLIQYPAAKTGSHYTVPKSVTNVENYAFVSCTSLKGIYFQGDAPSSVVFIGTPATVYYLPGTTNWSSTFGGRPAVLWNPRFLVSDASFGIRTNRFCLSIAGTTNIPIVLEACMNLASPVWQPLQTCTLTNGSLYFNDPNWTNYPARLYRIRSP